MQKNIVVTGVAGQAVHLLSKIIGEAAIISSADVKISNVREVTLDESAVTFVRIGEAGEKVHSPVIGKGRADVILSLELLETARCLPYLKNGGTIVTSTQQIHPSSVKCGDAEYPDEIISDIRFLGVDLRAYDVPSIAKDAGFEGCGAALFIGLAADVLGFEYDVIRQSIAACVSDDEADAYLGAFDLGYKFSRKA